jgi:hypothetical protein
VALFSEVKRKSFSTRLIRLELIFCLFIITPRSDAIEFAHLPFRELEKNERSVDIVWMLFLFMTQLIYRFMICGGTRCLCGVRRASSVKS